MADKCADNIMADLLGPEPEMAGRALPSVDERSELLLRAIHGDRLFSASERETARARILDEMAASLLDAGQKDDALVATRASVPAASARHATAATPPRETILDRLLRDLFYPLIPGAFQTPQRRMAFVTAAVVVLVAGGWTGTWFYAAQAIENQLAAANYSCASRAKAGFPLKIELHCAAPHLTTVAQNETYEIKAKELIATASLLSPRDFRGDIEGPITIAQRGQTVAFADGDLGFDASGNLNGTLKFTTTSTNFQRFASAFVGGNAAQLAQTYQRSPNDTDAASSADGELNVGIGPIVDVPLSLNGGAISLGSTALGRFPSLFSNAASERR